MFRVGNFDACIECIEEVVDPLAAAYLYSSDRRVERPASHLAGFKDVLQVDGYPDFERLLIADHIELAACWAHTRRNFYDVHQATASPIAAEALKRIAELYAIDFRIAGYCQPISLRRDRVQIPKFVQIPSTGRTH